MENEYESVLLSENYDDFLRRHLIAAERLTALLEDDWPGNPEIIKHRQLCAELRKRIEEFKVLNDQRDDGFINMVVAILDDFRKTYEDPYFSDKPKLKTERLKLIVRQHNESFKIKVQEHKIMFFHARNEWLNDILKRKKAGKN